MTTATRQPGTRTGRADRVAKIVAAAAGMFFLVPGLWAFFAPASFFEAAAAFDPYNAHFIRDIGAFQIGLGAVLVLSAFVRDALLVGLAGVGVGASFHVVAHVIDHDLGGDPAVDIPLFAVVALVLLGAAAVRALEMRR